MLQHSIEFKAFDTEAARRCNRLSNLILQDAQPQCRKAALCVGVMVLTCLGPLW